MKFPRTFNANSSPVRSSHRGLCRCRRADLLKRLRQDGTLDNTLVLITSDESRGMQGNASDLDCEMSHNWGFLLAITPTGPRGSASTSRSCKVIWPCRSSIIWAWRIGPSVRGPKRFPALRRAAADSVANVYFGTVTLFDVDGSISICPDDFHGGRRYYLASPWLFGGRKDGTAVGVVEDGIHDDRGALESGAIESQFGSSVPRPAHSHALAQSVRDAKSIESFSVARAFMPGCKSPQYLESGPFRETEALARESRETICAVCVRSPGRKRLGYGKQFVQI